VSQPSSEEVILYPNDLPEPQGGPSPEAGPSVDHEGQKVSDSDAPPSIQSPPQVISEIIERGPSQRAPIDPGPSVIHRVYRVMITIILTLIIPLVTFEGVEAIYNAMFHDLMGRVPFLNPYTSISAMALLLSLLIISLKAKQFYVGLPDLKELKASDLVFLLLPAVGIGVYILMFGIGPFHNFIWLKWALEPVYLELVFRSIALALVLAALKEYLPRNARHIIATTAISASSALVYLYNVDFAPNAPAVFMIIYTFLTSALYIQMTLKTKSIYPALIAHIGANLMATLL
jgi:hypothetical protein